MIPRGSLNCRSLTENNFFQKKSTNSATEHTSETETQNPVIDTRNKRTASLDQTVKEIIDYAKTQGLQVFHAARQGNYSRGNYGDGSSMFYSEFDTTCNTEQGKEGWKRFLDIGKGLKISFIIMRTKRLEEIDLDIFKAVEKVAEESRNNKYPASNNAKRETVENDRAKMSKEDYGNGHRTKDNNDNTSHPSGKPLSQLCIDLGSLSKHIGRVGRYEIQWLAEGKMFLWSESANWYEPVANLLVGDDDSKMMLHDGPKHLPVPPTPEARLSRWSRARSSKSSLGSDASLNDGRIGKSNSGNYLKKEQQQVPSILKDKAKEELVKEMVEFALKRQTDFTRGLGMTIQFMFWKEEKGLVWTSSNLPREWFDYTKDIGREASSRLLAIQKSKEVAAIPGVAEEYVQWFRENNFFRHSKAYVQMFLAQKCLRFSGVGLTMLSVHAERRLKELASRRDSTTSQHQRGSNNDKME